jgi:hypothetical protein
MLGYAQHDNNKNISLRFFVAGRGFFGYDHRVNRRASPMVQNVVNRMLMQDAVIRFIRVRFAHNIDGPDHANRLAASVG